MPGCCFKTCLLGRTSKTSHFCRVKLLQPKFNQETRDFVHHVEINKAQKNNTHIYFRTYHWKYAGAGGKVEKQIWWTQTRTKRNFTMFTAVIWTQISSLKCKSEWCKRFNSVYIEMIGRSWKYQRFFHPLRDSVTSAGLYNSLSWMSVTHQCLGSLHTELLYKILLKWKWLFEIR